MKLGLFRSKERELDSRIQALRQERELCMQHIRTIRADMDALVEQAVDADDLDRKILSLDYTALKGQLNAESERFQDLSRLITRIQGLQAVERRGRRLEYIASVREGIDEDALRRSEDEIEARRAMIEESDWLDSPEDAAPDISETAFVPDADFACRIAQARLRQHAGAGSRAADADPSAMPAG